MTSPTTFSPIPKLEKYPIGDCVSETDDGYVPTLAPPHPDRNPGTIARPTPAPVVAINLRLVHSQLILWVFMHVLLKKRTVFHVFLFPVNKQ
jgi:hypothetical protein